MSKEPTWVPPETPLEERETAAAKALGRSVPREPDPDSPDPEGDAFVRGVIDHDEESFAKSGREGSIYNRELEDGRELTVYPMLFTFRLCIGEAGAGTYDDAWCYDNAFDAILAAKDWDGKGDDPPHGWHRHIGSGRRRPDGDPTREYVQS